MRSSRTSLAHGVLALALVVVGPSVLAPRARAGTVEETLPPAVAFYAYDYDPLTGAADSPLFHFTFDPNFVGLTVPQDPPTEGRAVFEFDLRAFLADPGKLVSAWLEIPVVRTTGLTLRERTMGVPATLEVFGYAGDGLAAAADYAAGSVFLASFDMVMVVAGDVLRVDVSGHAAELLADGTGFLGVTVLPGGTGVVGIGDARLAIVRTADPAERLAQLIDLLVDPGSGIDRGTARSLAAKADAALRSLGSRPDTALRQLQALAAEARALSGKQLDPALAAFLVGEVEAVAGEIAAG
jgi:hypothetical protein